jgi:hypothetical protein
MLRFELLSVTEAEGRSAVEYRRHSNIDGEHPAHVLELIEWEGDRITAVRVFTSEPASRRNSRRPCRHFRGCGHGPFGELSTTEPGEARGSVSGLVAAPRSLRGHAARNTRDTEPREFPRRAPSG